MREQGITDGGSNFRSNNAALYNYANALYASQSNEDNILLRDNEELDRFIEAFVRANSENTRIVKYMKPEYIYDTKLLLLLRLLRAIYQEMLLDLKVELQMNGIMMLILKFVNI